MADKTEPEGEAKKKKGKKVLAIPLVVLLIGLGVGGYLFTQKKPAKVASGATTTSTTVQGKIIRLDPTTLNLADDHVLKVAIALQLVDKPKNKELATAATAAPAASSAGTTTSPLGGDEALALDQAISSLGDMTYAQLLQPGARTAAKEALSKKVKDIYGGDVTQVYFTEFVMS